MRGAQLLEKVAHAEADIAAVPVGAAVSGACRAAVGQHTKRTPFRSRVGCTRGVTFHSLSRA